MSGVEELLEKKLADPAFFKTLGEIEQPVLDEVKVGLTGLPEVALKDFLNSRFQVVIADPETWEETMQAHKVDSALIEKYKIMQGYAAFTGDEMNIAFGGTPHIVIFKQGDDISDTPNVTRHEVAHALDHINAGYEGLLSNRPEFREAYKKYEDSEKLDQRMHAKDIRFADHKKSYDQFNHSIEVVAEMMQKYSALCERGFPQVAERIMTNEFPHVWDAMKKDMPQIGQSLTKHGLDANARPLKTAPEDILTHQYLHREMKEFEYYISTHGLSQNETDAVMGHLTALGFHPENRTKSDTQIFASIVLKADEIEQFRTLRNDMIEARKQEVPIASQKHNDEEFRIAKALFPNVTGLFRQFTLAKDGALILEIDNEYDISELGQQIGVPDLSERDRIKTSSKGSKTLAVSFNRLPEQYRANLAPGFNAQSGLTEQKRVSAQKHKPEDDENLEL